MKQIITLFIASLIAVSLTGQTVKGKAVRQETREQLTKTERFNGHNMERRHVVNKLPAYRENSADPLRSPLEIKQKLDSTIYEEYDEDAGQWVVSSKSEYDYYSDGKIKTQTGFCWIENKGHWLGRTKFEYSYSNNGEMIQQIYNGWDFDTGQWVLDSKLEYTHDNDGNIIQWLYYKMDEESSQWLIVSKCEFVYDGNGNRTLETTYFWNDVTSQWVNFDKTEYTYNNDGNMTSQTEYYWDEGQWTEEYKNEHTYDNDGYLTLIIGSYWELNQWIKEYKEELVYDADGNLILETDYDWDNQWIKNWKWESVFDGNSNLIEEHSYNWEGTWVELFKYDYTYNNSYAYDNLILPIIYNEYYYFYNTYWLEVYNNHMLLTSIRSYPATKDWNEKYKTTYYYSEIDVSGISEASDNNITIFPNPAVDKFQVHNSGFRVSTATIELYDLNGKKLLEKDIPKGTKIIEIDVSSLDSGVYFCKLNTENHSVTKKVIIKK